MTITSDIAADWAYIEGVETVTFTPANPSSASITTVKALRRQLSRATQFGGPALIEPSDVPWHLWSATLQGLVPKPGDRITDSAGVSWRIITQSFSPRTSRYRCVCRQEAT